MPRGFIKIAKQHKTFQHAEHEKAWIIRITINASKDTKDLSKTAENVNKPIMSPISASDPPLFAANIGSVRSSISSYKRQSINGLTFACENYFKPVLAMPSINLF